MTTLVQRHAAILFFPAFVAAACFSLLIRDFRMEDVDAGSTEPPLARIERALGDVKRKPEKRMVWFSLRSSQDLFRRDSVRTAAGSTTVIKFENGSQVELGENSLIVLEQSKNSVAIEFVSGSVFSKGGAKDGKGGAAGSGVVLRSKGMEINTGSAEVELVADKNGAASVNVKAGEVKVESAGKEIKIAENQQGTLTDKGVSEIVEIPLKLVSPERGALLLFDRAKPSLELAWETLKPVEDAVVEISSDRDFRSVVKSIKAAGRTRVDAGALPGGNYYWRVAAKQAAPSEVRTFEVLQKAPIHLIEPAAGKMIRFAKAAPRMIFQWTGPAYFDRYTLELAADAEFKKIERTEKIEDGATQLALNLDKSGPLYWRIRGSSSRVAATDASEGRDLQLRKLDKVEPPELLAPAPGMSMPAERGDSVTIDFRWAALEEASEYQLEIAGDEDFSKILEVTKTPQTSFRWQTKKLGRLYWRVSVLDLDHQLVQSRKKQDLVVVSSVPLKLLEPVDRIKLQYLSDRPKITLNWEEEKESRGYEVELARDNGFKEVVSRKKAAEPRLALADLEDGTYFWRARALDAGGSPFRGSQVFSFEVKAKELLGPPTALAPAPGHVIASLTESDVELEFSWEEIPGASEYQMLIVPAKVQGGARLPASEKEAVFDKKFKVTHGRAQRLPAGEYAWAVRSIDSLGRAGRVGNFRPFTVKQVDVLPPPGEIDFEVEQRRR